MTNLPTQTLRKEFKINGKIGLLPGQKDKLSFASLIYQITQGEKRGYPENEICEAVIQSISPDLNLRSYLEGKINLTISNLSKILRSHFQELDATNLFAELTNAKQSVSENAQRFVIRMMSLRQKVLFVSKEDPIPYPPALVQRRFSHAVLSGLRNNNIRNNLRPLLENESTSDEFLLECLTKAVTEETEHYEKFSKKSTVNSVTNSDSISPPSKPKENELLQELKALRVQVNELSALKSEVSHLRNRMSENEYKKIEPRNRRDRKYENCVAQNVRKCEHCFRCGSAEHFRAGCRVRRLEKNASELVQTGRVQLLL